MNCQFCLTALMGLERNLTAGEIVGQVLFVMRAHGISTARSEKPDRLNIVMMGMGEPLLNLPNVIKATRLLADPAAWGFRRGALRFRRRGSFPRWRNWGGSRCGRSWRFR